MNNRPSIKVFDSLARMRTRTLIFIPLLLGFLCILVLIIIWQSYTGALMQQVLLSTSFLFFGLSGLPMIIRQEADFSLFSLDGPLAVILGVIVFASGLIVASSPLWGALLRDAFIGHSLVNTSLLNIIRDGISHTKLNFLPIIATSVIMSSI